MGKDYKNTSRTFKAPRRPYEKERIDNELQLIGKYGLKNKREVWRVQLLLAKIRKAARELLTREEKDPKRLFEGQSLMRRMFRYGLLNENENKLDYVLGLTIHRLLDRRLQTIVYKKGLAQSVHHARVLIRQRHIKVGKNIVTTPQYMVRMDTEKHIDYAPTSPFGGGKPGRVKQKLLKIKQKGGGEAIQQEN